MKEKILKIFFYQLPTIINILLKSRKIITLKMRLTTEERVTSLSK